MNSFLISFESGKNNIGGMPLHIIKSSRIVLAENFEDANRKARDTEYTNRYSHSHFGYDPDYFMITDIKKLI